MGGLGRGRRMTLQSKSPPVHRWRKLRPCALSMWMYNFFHLQFRQATDGKKTSYSLCDEWLISMPANGGMMWSRACWGDWFKSVSLSSSSLVWYQATSHTRNASVVSPSTLDLIKMTLGWLTGIPEILWLVTLWYRESDCGNWRNRQSCVDVPYLLEICRCLKNFKSCWSSDVYEMCRRECDAPLLRGLLKLVL